MCVEGTCVDHASLKAGDDCGSESSCDFGLWCREGKCETANAIPDLCTTNDDCERLFGPGIECMCSPSATNPEKRCMVLPAPGAAYKELYYVTFPFVCLTGRRWKHAWKRMDAQERGPLPEVAS